MHNGIYPVGTVEALLQSDEVRQPTKQVLKDRLDANQRPDKHLFDDESFAVLEAVCNRLFPQERLEKIPLPQMLETALVKTPGVGWRYEVLPPITTTILQGIKAIDAEAMSVHQSSFPQLASSLQDELLKTVQAGKAMADDWKNISSDLFFTELLVRLTEAYYSHPFAKDEIGDVSFADAHGWQHLGLNNIESREPKPRTVLPND